MRRLAILLIVGALAAACGHHHSHAVQPTLPRIHERFTVLPCPRAKLATTLAIEGCAEHAILRTDAAIEQEERAIFSNLERRGRRAFARAERAWLTYRASTCNTASSPYAGGSLEPVVYATCVADENRRHLDDLAKRKADLPHG